MTTEIRDATGEVEQVVQDLDDAFNRGDVEAILEFYEPDAVMVVHPKRIARGRDELRAVFGELVTSGSSAKQHKMHILESDGLALFTSEWSLVDADGTEQRRLTATSVFRRGVEGRWRLVIDNSFGPAVLG